MEQQPLLQLEGVCYAYEGIVALRKVTLDIRRGETVVLQGANGCGKSTLLKLLNGLIFPEEGHYRFDGHDITTRTMKNSAFAKHFHQRMGFVFQNADVQLFCSSVAEEIAFGPRQMGLEEAEVQRRVEDVLALLELEPLRERAPYHLSGGEKRKAALGCILSMNPEVLVLDEPLAGLDRKTQRWLTEFLLALQRAGKTMVISTHNDALAERLAQRLVIMGDDHSIEKIIEVPNNPQK
jgi:cobalt/nickel transport system ATP-binding protein